jgi:hypothetical protein
MSKAINFNYNGVAYTLEFTRETVVTMERQGFNLDDIDSKPMTVIPTLFAGAFMANHKHTSKKIIDAIYSKLPNKQELVLRLAEMYREPIEALIDETEDEEGNVEWGTSW